MATYLATFISGTFLIWLIGYLFTIISEGEANIYHWVGFISTVVLFVVYLLALKSRHD